MSKETGEAMRDQQIIELFEQRSEAAIAETARNTAPMPQHRRPLFYGIR
jgi:hypothetical protein